MKWWWPFGKHGQNGKAEEAKAMAFVALDKAQRDVRSLQERLREIQVRAHESIAESIPPGARQGVDQALTIRDPLDSIPVRESLPPDLEEEEEGHDGQQEERQ